MSEREKEGDVHSFFGLKVRMKLSSQITQNREQTWMKEECLGLRDDDWTMEGESYR